MAPFRTEPKEGHVAEGAPEKAKRNPFSDVEPDDLLRYGLIPELVGRMPVAVPLDALEETVEELADRLAMVPTDLLSGNKRSVNLAMELMGARTMQRLAAEMDARMHTSPSMEEWRTRNREQGLRAALEWRDGRFSNPEMRRQWQQEHWPEGPRPSKAPASR